MNALIHVDVCSGIGAFGVAAAHAGFHTAAFCEIDEYPRRVLARHFPEAYIHDDIKTFTGNTLRERGVDHVDLFSGGIPCQPFSVAGKHGGTKDDRHLWPYALRFITDMRPRWVCIENVSGFIPVALDLVLSELEAEGYTAGAVVLPACAVNAPHRRDRVWIVAHAGLSERPGRVALESGSEGQTRRVIASCDLFTGAVAGVAQGDTPRKLGGGALPTWSGRDGLTDTGSLHADPSCERMERNRATGQQEQPASPEKGLLGRDNSGCRTVGGSTQSGMGRVPDVPPSWLDGLRWPAPLGASPFEWEPARTEVGVKNRTARLKACGNAIVWPVAATIFHAIREVL